MVLSSWPHYYYNCLIIFILNCPPPVGWMKQTWRRQNSRRRLNFRFRLRADAFPCLSWRGVRSRSYTAERLRVSPLLHTHQDLDAGARGSRGQEIMAPKSANKQQSEEDLLLQDFSRNLSAKSTALFYGNALIVSAIPICKCGARHANRLMLTHPALLLLLSLL